jgi:hypothetical protein
MIFRYWVYLIISLILLGNMAIYVMVVRVYKSLDYIRYESTQALVRCYVAGEIK